MVMLGRCCLCEPPVPYEGKILRQMFPTAIADYESLSDATYTAGQYYTGTARNFSTKVNTYGGHQLNCLTYMLDVPGTATGEQSAILQPVRYTIDETNSSGGNFDYWETPSHPGRFSPVLNQFFSSDTLLPASGNSHMDNSDPHQIRIMSPLGVRYGQSTFNALRHVWQQLDGYEQTVSTWFKPPLPVSFGVFPRYIQYRKNGTAYGPLHDLEDYWAALLAPYGVKAMHYPYAYDILFPSTTRLWQVYGSHLQNWNFQFADGDEIDVDVWFEIRADPVAGSDRAVVISIGRDEVSSGSHSASDESDSWVPSGSTIFSYAALADRPLTLYGIDASPGWDPATDTYTYTPADGSATLGKATPTGARVWAIDSGSLTWAPATQTYTTPPQAGSGSSTWQSDNGDPWELIADNCTTGDPTEPTSDPPDPTDPPSSTLAFGGCEIAGVNRDLNIYLQHDWRDEMSWLSIEFHLDPYGLPSDPDHEAAEFVKAVYRPANATPTADYPQTVYSRREASDVAIGPTGCFDHLGSTEYELWWLYEYDGGSISNISDQVQTGTTHDSGHSSLSAILQDIVPTSITVDHGAA